MKCAYFVRPHIGGTYSVFTRLRSSLAQSQTELRWLAAGYPNDIIDLTPPHLSDAGRFGDAVDQLGVLDEKTRATRFINFLRDNRYEAVFVNVLANQFETNLIRYLPANILRIMIVHNITPGTYAAAHAIRDHVHATIGVSKRCRDDLIAHYGFDEARTIVIPHGLSADRSASATCEVRRARLETGAPVRLLYLGRVEDNSKGVFWLPSILKSLQCPYSLTVAGDGPDLAQLRKRLAPFHDKVQFTGWVAPENVPHLARHHDILIMPSRYEGFGLTLIEAMSQGCPAVVSHIGGVTDTIVTHGKDGVLFPVGDWRKAVRLINELATNPSLLTSMADAAIEKVATSFDSTTAGSAYLNLLERLRKDPPVVHVPLQLSSWTMPLALHTSLRSHLPRPVKNWLRHMRERLYTTSSPA
ncbi:glycosyltransferase family 4 protein [Ochrobactrum sp. CM-21-5]|nr:glycosyltransferase family 4 protein [Ochrobactrum sp. CM-21-5]MBC2886425.1 glycosyltransferase family 4 protein [Ochrobactrum sp. CM-21-5]